MQAFTTLFALPASLWSDQPLWFTTKLPLVNIPSAVYMCASDLWLQRKAEPHKEIEPYRVNWLQGFSIVCPSPASLRAEGLSPHLEFLLFRLRAISLTACAWDITMLKPYCVKKRQNGMWSVNAWVHTNAHTHLTDLSQSAYELPVFFWRHRYLVVHDRSQAHDANMHVVFLAHETGVLDGSAAGNWAVAATGRNQTFFF